MRLTDKQTDVKYVFTTLSIKAISDKLGKLEDLMEQYNIEDAEALDLLLFLLQRLRKEFNFEVKENEYNLKQLYIKPKGDTECHYGFALGLSTEEYNKLKELKNGR